MIRQYWSAVCVQGACVSLCQGSSYLYPSAIIQQIRVSKNASANVLMISYFMSYALMQSLVSTCSMATNIERVISPSGHCLDVCLPCVTEQTVSIPWRQQILPLLWICCGIQCCHGGRARNPWIEYWPLSHARPTDKHWPLTISLGLWTRRYHGHRMLYTGGVDHSIPSFIRIIDGEKGRLCKRVFYISHTVKWHAIVVFIMIFITCPLNMNKTAIR